MTAVLARRHEPRPSSPLSRKPPDVPHDPVHHPPPPQTPLPPPAKSLDASSLPLSKRRPVRSLTRRDAFHASLCAVAIMSTLMVYSLLQERIMTRPYTSRTSLTAFFPHSLFLVLANRLLAALMAAVVILIRRERAHLQPVAPVTEYISVSISNVVATSCQYEALKWLTFPTVTIGKCAKMLPVMLIQKMRSGRHYSYDDFAVVAVVLAGCATMISSGNVSAKHSSAADTDTPVGFLLMLLYLLFDAITSTQQESLFDRYDMSLYNQMLYINLSSACISVFALTLSRALPQCLAFLNRFPSILPDIAALSLSAVAGQFAITYTIQMYGALLYAAVMTTRQFCSVLASDIIFKHGLTVLQWTGALMVFSALFFKLWRKATRSSE
ncbi:Adenosine 3'-phospho 5'-phosphosulfate transporter 1 [Gracilariopsis chorda]|uniref:Adenosine 3'-phospho 5'-phosphosulfate transporter 1 n=1 Tax=Gracilariopsis chorda TaxID=448386 RepID=A0A2V3IRQ2_9FLOR|nr:Adenosine 3'-phospho 5'-phosphosulfate transporter 1 [Gracilariopsis chorda]|eukprot:PXF44802.1 Adenosine 3'-phospho 5'-phosphosulfate transporter 1 [Gracilariopsis chorda]